MPFELLTTYFWLVCGLFWTGVGVSVYYRGRKLLASGAATEEELRKFAIGLVVAVWILCLAAQVLQLVGGYKSGFYIYCAETDLISILTWGLFLSCNFALGAWILLGRGTESLVKFGPLLNLPPNRILIKGIGVLFPAFSLGMVVCVFYLGFGSYACDA